LIEAVVDREVVATDFHVEVGHPSLRITGFRPELRRIGSDLRLYS
jgi:hypothetical protein